MAKATNLVAINEDWVALTTTEDNVIITGTPGVNGVQIAVAAALADLNSDDVGIPLRAARADPVFSNLGTLIVFGRCTEGDATVLVTAW